MPDDRHNKVSCSNYHCEIELTLELIGGKWKSLILWNLHQHEPIRYSEFKQYMPKITQKMLTQQLKELEKYRLISKEIFPSVPPMVEYSLTPMGEELMPIMDLMDKWGKKYVEFYKNDRD